MRGVICALLAAICNSCIGIFSSILIMHGMSSLEIAFWRCLVALSFTFCLCMINTNIRREIKLSKKELFQYAVLSFFGINIMYMFETTAIQFIPISLVSFLLYASGIITIVLSCVFLKEKMKLIKLCSIILVLVGIAIMFISNMEFSGNLVGIFFAIIAGAGYSLYIFLNKKWSIQSGLRTLLFIFFFGTIFLGIQVFASNNAEFSIKLENVHYVVLLAIIPTIGGFYFTNKALSYSQAGEVQLLEMSEPFIATLLGFVILKQVVSYTEILGGIFIIIGLLVLEKENLIKIIVKRRNKIK